MAEGEHAPAPARRRVRGRRGARSLAARADQIAWRVIQDLCRPDGEFGRLPPEQLQQLIDLRLTRDAAEEGVPVDDLGAAFERAVRDFTGARSAPDE